MNSNADHDEEIRPDDELDPLLRKVDASALRALSEDLDVEERLARLKSSPTVSDHELAEVMARWTAELITDATRGNAALLRPVDDPAFFAAAVGRARTGLEPWPEMQVALGEATPQAIAVAISLPGLAAGVRVVASIRLGSWAGVTELVPPDAAGQHADAPETEVSGTIIVPDELSLESLSGVEIELTVKGR